MPGVAPMEKITLPHFLHVKYVLGKKATILPYIKLQETAVKGGYSLPTPSTGEELPVSLKDFQELAHFITKLNAPVPQDLLSLAWQAIQCRKEVGALFPHQKGIADANKKQWHFLGILQEVYSVLSAKDREFKTFQGDTRRNSVSSAIASRIAFENMFEALAIKEEADEETT
jgi:hypothetical protein